jgi:hypothetical protein
MYAGKPFNHFCAGFGTCIGTCIGTCAGSGHGGFA